MSDDEAPEPTRATSPRPRRSRPSRPSQPSRPARRKALDEEPEADLSAAEKTADASFEDEDEEPRVARPDPKIPAFARGWSLEGPLAGLVATFEAGDYGRVREEARALARSTDDDEVRRAARDLIRRTEPDPLALRMLMAAALVLIVLAGWYWSHPHHAS